MPLVDPRSTPQDLVHTVSAVVGFVAACFAMLQVASSSRHPRVARWSLVSCVAVASVSAMGGLLAIVRLATDVGAWLEIGTTVAIVWIAGYSLTLPRVAPPPTPAGTDPIRRRTSAATDGAASWGRGRRPVSVSYWVTTR